MALAGVLLGELLDALQADETAANTIHEQRSEKAREVDDSEWSSKQTDDLQTWLDDPSEYDFTTVDTPAFKDGAYDPLEEFNRG